jgi:methyl-accepting chemotaxis protein
MTQSPPWDESALCEALQHQNAVYQRLLAELAGGGGELATADAIFQASQRVANTLQSVAEQESRFQQLMANRRASGRPASPQLRQAVDEARANLQQLIAKVDETVESYQQLKKRMLPQMDETVRQRQAVRSYRRLAGES